MKKILISYPAMMLGGSTTSLLSILNRLNPDEYQVDLLLDRIGGPWMAYIPPGVRVLPQAYTTVTGKRLVLKKLLNPRYLFHFALSKYIGWRDKNPRHGVQYFESSGADFFRSIDEEYDVAIAFLEGRQCKLVARNVMAKRKVAWIHIDYGSSGFDPRYDVAAMSAFDAIALVSDQCKEAFDIAFPTLTDRTCVIENILSAQHLRHLAEGGIDYPVNPDALNLVTTCRINFGSKGLDRAVTAMATLKQEGLLDQLHWYILGDGADKPALEQLIAEAKLEKHITLLGMQTNPYGYLKHMSLFFLPSRWEGKPMAVTEAFMLGLPALVTEYASAREQIRDGIDGKIVANSTDGIYEGLRYLIEHPDEIACWKAAVEATEYSNEAEMAQVLRIIEG